MSWLGVSAAATDRKRLLRENGPYLGPFSFALLQCHSMLVLSSMKLEFALEN